MKITQFIIFVFLLFIVGSSAFGQSSVATWKVQKYDLNVTLPQDEKTRSISVKAILNLKNVSGKPASTLTLRISTAADVTAIKINDTTADFTKSEEKISASSSLQRLVLLCPDRFFN